MSQDENGDERPSSEMTEYAVSSANLFEKGNTPFRRGLSSNGTADSNGSPVRKNAKNPDKLIKFEKITRPEEINLEDDGEHAADLGDVSITSTGSDQPPGSRLNIEEISKEIPSFTESLATFEKEWNSIIDKYSNVEDQGDVIDLASGSIVKNNGHLELLEDEEDTIWDSMFPKQKEGEEEDKAGVSAPSTPSLLQQLGEFHSESEEEEEEKEEKSTKKRRISLWDV